MQRGGERCKLGWDHVGALRAVIDAQGVVVKEMEYDAFGNILRETNAEFKMPFGFAGGLHDRDTNLIRYRFKDYLPDMGRFAAKDPIGYKGGDADLYGYCLDDPVNGIDPSGLQLGLAIESSVGGGATQGNPFGPGPIEDEIKGTYLSFGGFGVYEGASNGEIWGSRAGASTDVLLLLDQDSYINDDITYYGLTLGPFGMRAYNNEDDDLVAISVGIPAASVDAGFGYERGQSKTESSTRVFSFPTQRDIEDYFWGTFHSGDGHQFIFDR